jgi:hypothetical protein
MGQHAYSVVDELLSSSHVVRIFRNTFQGVPDLIWQNILGHHKPQGERGMPPSSNSSVFTEGL